MARLAIICVLVVVCACLAVSESKVLDKKALIAKLTAERRANAETAKKDNDVSNLKALLQRKLASSQKREEVKSAYQKKDGDGTSTTEQDGMHIFTSVLNSGKKRGIAFFPESKNTMTDSKKDYQAVFSIGDALLAIIEGYNAAPCTFGVLAVADMLAKFDWEGVDWNNLHENTYDNETLTFLRWWTDNKCSEFFMSEHTFYFYVWSMFWQGLEQTPCFNELPHDSDGSINFNIAFEKVNSYDPVAWENYPPPQTECEIFEMVGEIYFDFFFSTYFDAMPNNLLEDIFEDYQIAPIDPYWGYHHLANANSYGNTV